MLLLLRQSPKKVCAAVNTIAVKDERSWSVVIYGISESDGEKLENKVAEVLGEINEKPSLRDCCRVGLKRADTSRPTKLSLERRGKQSLTEFISDFIRNNKIVSSDKNSVSASSEEI